MRDLIVSEQGIDGHENPAGERRAEACGDGFHTFFEVHRDAIIGLQVGGKKAVRHGRDLMPQLAVTQSCAPIDESGALGRERRLYGDEVMETEWVS